MITEEEEGKHSCLLVKKGQQTEEGKQTCQMEASPYDKKWIQHS